MPDLFTPDSSLSPDGSLFSLWGNCEIKMSCTITTRGPWPTYTKLSISSRTRKHSVNLCRVNGLSHNECRTMSSSTQRVTPGIEAYASTATEVMVDQTAKIVYHWSSLVFFLAFRHIITFPFSSKAGSMQTKQ